MATVVDDVINKHDYGDDIVENVEHAALTQHPSDREPYGPSGVTGILYNPFVALCASCATLDGLLFGYDQGVVSVILVTPQFLDRFPEVNSGFWKGLLTAMIELGAVIGAFNQGWIADKYSRRYSIILAIVIFTIGAVLQTAAVDYAMMTVARLIGGFGIGMLSMVAPLYISEVSLPEIRGTLLVIEEFCIVLGIVIAYWITYGTRFMAGDWSWRLPFLLQMIPGFILLTGVAMLPFPPRWLAAQGRESEALQNLAKLRVLPPTDRRVRQEFFDIICEVRYQKEAGAERHPQWQDGRRKSAIMRELISGPISLRATAYGEQLWVSDYHFFSR